MTRIGEKQIYVSPKKRCVCNVVAAVILIAMAAVLVLCYCGIIPLEFGSIASGVVLSAIGLIFFCNALIQFNSVSMWLAFCFLIPAAVSFVCRNGYAAYGDLYPVYIALPGLACLGAMIISREFARLAGAAAIFIIAAAIFLLEVFGVLSIGWTLLVLFAYVAVLIGAVIVYFNKGEKK